MKVRSLITVITGAPSSHKRRSDGNYEHEFVCRATDGSVDGSVFNCLAPVHGVLFREKTKRAEIFIDVSRRSDLLQSDERAKQSRLHKVYMYRAPRGGLVPHDAQARPH